MEDKWYLALRAHDPEIYRRTLSYAKAVTINFNTPPKPAAEYERSMVMLACELLKVWP